MTHEARRGTDGRLILLLGALAACGPLATDMYLPTMPSIAQTLGTSAAAVEWTLSSFMLGNSVGMLLYGPLSDAYGRRIVLLGGLVLFVAASGGCWLSASIGQLVFMRCLQAMGAGAAQVLARVIARDAHEPDDAARVLSLVANVTMIGPLLAPLIGGQLLLLGGWRMVFVTLALFGLLCTLATCLRVPETWPPEKRASGAVINSFLAYARLVRDPIVWGYALCGGMGFAAMFAYICATPFVYIDHFHVSPQTYGLFFGLNVIGVIIGNFINARFVRRVGSLRMISAAALVSCVSSVYVAAVCLTGWGGLWAIVVGLFFVVGVIGMLAANCMTDMMYRYPRNAGAAAALFGAAQLGFGALATLTVGLWRGTSPVGMGWTIGVAGLLCYIGRMTIVRCHGRPTTEQQVAAVSPCSIPKQ